MCQIRASYRFRCVGPQPTVKSSEFKKSTEQSPGSIAHCKTRCKLRVAYRWTGHVASSLGVNCLLALWRRFVGCWKCKVRVMQSYPYHMAWMHRGSLYLGPRSGSIVEAMLGPFIPWMKLGIRLYGREEDETFSALRGWTSDRSACSLSLYRVRYPRPRHCEFLRVVTVNWGCGRKSGQINHTCQPDRQWTYNVKLRHIRETSVTVEKQQVLQILSVCL
jgi:hypothetical protein